MRNAGFVLLMLVARGALAGQAVAIDCLPLFIPFLFSSGLFPAQVDPSAYFIQAGNFPGKMKDSSTGVSSAGTSRPSSPVDDRPVPQDRNSNGGSGNHGQPPLQPEPQDEAAERDRLFDQLIQDMKGELEKLGEYVQSQGVKLVLVFDLDGTLYRSPRNGKEDNTLGLGGELFDVLQQHWFFLLDEFLGKNKAFFFLIYNTSRPYRILGPHDSGVATGREGSSIAINREKTTLWGPKGSNQRTLMRFPTNSKHSTLDELGIPRPDALIVGNGAYIQLSTEHKQRLGEAKLKQVNDAIAQWLGSDRKAILDAVGNIIELTRSQKVATTPPLDLVWAFVSLWIQSRDLDNSRFESKFRLPELYVVATALRCSEGYIGGVILQNSVVNKGITLRVLLDLLGPSLLSDGKPLLEVVFGDAVLDLPMLRPDIEIEAVAQLSEFSLLARDTRISFALGVATDRSNLAPIWHHSIVPDVTPFTGFGNPTVTSAIRHSKVLEVRGLALLGLIRGMNRRLTGN